MSDSTPLGESESQQLGDNPSESQQLVDNLSESQQLVDNPSESQTITIDYSSEIEDIPWEGNENDDVGKPFTMYYGDVAVNDDDEAKVPDTPPNLGNGHQDDINENESEQDPLASTSKDDANGTAEGEGNEETNPFAYLERDEFSSERFKIELIDMPKYFGYGELKKLINKKLGLNSQKIKVMTGGSKCTFVGFRSEEDRTKAISVLNGYSWKKATIKAVVAKPCQDPLIRKRAEDKETEGEPPAKRSKPTKEEVSTMSVNDRVRNVTMPWWNIPYTKQIGMKISEVENYMTNLTYRLCSVNPAIVKGANGKLNCDVEYVKSSPVTEEYRNKCEFTIGINPETGNKTVGFRVASYREGSTGVGPVAHLSHIPPQMKLAAVVFENYIRSTDISPYNPETHVGVWKQLTVRTNLAGDLMLMVILNVKDLEDDEVEDLKNKMKIHFQSVNEPRITSFYVKLAEMNGVRRSNVPVLLIGEPTITETLWNLKFRISPESFFQVNTKAAEVMYAAIRDLAKLDDKTSLLDICCGTGTVGICLAETAAQIIGVEIILDAVRDAGRNADDNGVFKKCTFYAGKAENLIDLVINNTTCEKVVAVVDPPRGGLHSRVIQCIRKADKIQSLVYAACDAKSAMRNFVDLCRPSSKTYRGEPFIPTKLVPVDLFPNTPHLEYIFLFERMTTITQSPTAE